MKVFGPGRRRARRRARSARSSCGSAEGVKTYEYIGAEARTLPGGWESLGDMGSIDADGYVYLTRPADRHDPRRRLERVSGRGRGCARRASARALVRGDRPARRRPRQPAARDRADRRRHADRRRRAARAPRRRDSCATRSRARSSSSAEPLRDDAGKLRRSALRADASTASERSGPTAWDPRTGAGST